MAGRRLWSRLRGPPINTGSAVTAGPVALTTPQCCTHRMGEKCVKANACPWLSANRPCTSGLPSENFYNRGPTRCLMHQGLRPKWVKPSRSLKKPPWYSIRPLPWRLLPRCTGVIIQCPPARRQVAFHTGAHQHHPCGPRAHQERHPQTRCTGGRWERQNKSKPHTTNGRSNCITQSAHWPRQWCHVGGKYWREWRQLGLCRVVQKITH